MISAFTDRPRVYQRQDSLVRDRQPRPPGGTRKDRAHRAANRTGPEVVDAAALVLGQTQTAGSSIHVATVGGLLDGARHELAGCRTVTLRPVVPAETLLYRRLSLW